MGGSKGGLKVWWAASALAWMIKHYSPVNSGKAEAVGSGQLADT